MIFTADEIVYIKGRGFVFYGLACAGLSINYTGQLQIDGLGRGEEFMVMGIEATCIARPDGLIREGERIGVLVGVRDVMDNTPEKHKCQTCRHYGGVDCDTCDGDYSNYKGDIAVDPENGVYAVDPNCVCDTCVYDNTSCYDIVGNCEPTNSKHVPKPAADPGEGYRLLVDGEVICVGDEWLDDNGEWRTDVQVGRVFFEAHLIPHRRAITFHT